MVDTRMDLSYDFIKAAQLQLQHYLVNLLWSNEGLQKDFKEQSKKEHAFICIIVEHWHDNSRWERMDVLISSLLVYFKRVKGLVVKISHCLIAPYMFKRNL